MTWTAPGTGELNRYLRFERRPVVADGMGNEEAQPWAPLSGPFSAALRPLNGREQLVVGRLAGVQPYELIVRYFDETRAVTTEDTAVDEDGQRYDLTAIQDPNQRRQWLSMLAKTGTAEE